MTKATSIFEEYAQYIAGRIHHHGIEEAERAAKAFRRNIALDDTKLLKRAYEILAERGQ